MRWALLLLTLTGQCLVSTCHIYSYTFIDEEKNWNDSQTYCREHHMDLAILFNGTDEESLDGSGGWIGLYQPKNATRRWHWSLPGETFDDNDTRWNAKEPNDKDGSRKENCVGVNSGKKWADLRCERRTAFICCHENQTCETVKSSGNNHMYEVKKNWREAQMACREGYKDLISGIKQFNLIKNDFFSGPVDWWWIGLFRDRWQWSNGISSNFRNWESAQDDTVQEKCAWIDLNESKKWKSADCTVKKSFFCYDDGMILIRESKTWEDAWDYCREKHRGLASVTDARQQQLIAARARTADTGHVWLGLRFSCTLGRWFWVTGEPFSSNMWPSNSKQEARRCYEAVAMETGGNHTWSQIDDDEELNFICIK